MGRAKGVRRAVLAYVIALGGYRVLYVFNWIYKRYEWQRAYHDYVSWLGGALECILFIDFCSRMFRGRWEAIEASFLGGAILALDDNSSRLSEKIELKALGRRLPLGVSGPGS